MTTSPHRKKKNFVPSTFKFLVAVSSLAGTLGIWSFLANKDLLQANAENSSSDPQTPGSLGLQPIPTLVPLITVDLNTLYQPPIQTGAVPVPTPSLRNVVPLPPVIANDPTLPKITGPNVGQPPPPIATTVPSKPVK
jgi:hypothetical protein